MDYTKEDWITAIRANPDDVVLMCAFSDWLEEQDDPMWEGMSLLAEYGIVGDKLGYYNFNFNPSTNCGIGITWWWSDWEESNDKVRKRIAICQEYSKCDNQTKAKIRRELAELYPHSAATLAARSRSLPA